MTWRLCKCCLPVEVFPSLPLLEHVQCIQYSRVSIYAVAGSYHSFIGYYLGWARLATKATVAGCVMLGLCPVSGLAGIAQATGL